MDYTFGRVETDDELRAVQRLRYAVYVEELGRYASRADHANRLFPEPEDETSWIFFARAGDEVVAATRISWGGNGFSERQIEQYQLAPFLDEIPPEMIVVGERAMITPALRGTNLLFETMQHGRAIVDDIDIHVVFGCCEPHLLGMYINIGQRPYSARNINSEEAGYLIPLVSFIPDVDALRGVGRALPDALPRCVEQALAHTGNVKSHALSAPGEYWHEIHGALQELHAQRISVFDEFTDDEAERCIARSNIIRCDTGDRVLKKGGTARNIFVVLSGTLETRDDSRLVGVLSPGDVFGEMAFLLERERTFNVEAVTGDVRVLSLSEGALRKMIAEDPVVAAKLLLNVSKMLCVRLIGASS
jgi:hypothetical protein